jgi:nicotinamide-nucleotide amidase
VRTRTLRTTGVAESQLPDLLGDAASGFDGMSLAYLPGQEGVDLRLTLRNVTPEEADERLQRGIELLLERVGDFGYTCGSADMAEVVLEACRARALSLAVAESCTGGMLGARLTAIPGSSDVLRGGVIAYADSVKRATLGVGAATLESVGAVSDEVAREMAAGVRARLDADIGVGITGIAGPGGGTPEKPVGQVWIAVDVQGRVRSFGGRLVGDRAEIRFRATQIALDMIRRALRRGD